MLKNRDAILILLIILFLIQLSYAKDIYKCTNSDSKFYFSTKFCEGGETQQNRNKEQPTETTPNVSTQKQDSSKDIPESQSLEEDMQSETLIEDVPDPGPKTMGRELKQEISEVEAKIHQIKKKLKFYDPDECYKSSPINFWGDYGGREYVCEPRRVKYEIYAREFARLVAYRNKLLNALNSSAFQTESNKFLCDVTNVVDGDTFDCILANGSEERIRLLGVGAPESGTVEGEKVTWYTQSYLRSETTVSLELDVQHRDEYGRILAYVYLIDGTMLNALLVQQGYATVSTYSPNVKYESLFISAQKEAIDNHRGFWK